MVSPKAICCCFGIYFVYLRKQSAILHDMDRSQEIIRTSWIGIVANVLLAGFKAAVCILGALISLVIIKAGIEMLASPINELLGTSIPAEPSSADSPARFSLWCLA